MAFRLLIMLCSLAAAGCAVVERATPTTAPAAPALATPDPGSAPSPVPPEETVADGAAPYQALTPPPPVAARPPAPVPIREHAAPDIATTGPDHHGAITAPRSPEAPAASQPAPDTLDFASLGARLRATKALGVLTKLSVKNEADGLLQQFRDYYEQRGTATLPDLHRSYDSLVLKLLSLLQDADPPLATDIDRSRGAIWDILSDQRKFIESHLMAGASPQTDLANR